MIGTAALSPRQASMVALGLRESDRLTKLLGAVVMQLRSVQLFMPPCLGRIRIGGSTMACPALHRRDRTLTIGPSRTTRFLARVKRLVSLFGSTTLPILRRVVLSLRLSRRRSVTARRKLQCLGLARLDRLRPACLLERPSLRLRLAAPN